MKNTSTNFLTIFTPTYNRGDELERLYASLKIQTNKLFKWLIIDDGSNDDTKQLIDRIINEATFEIRYLYKDNGGKHTAINKMLEIADTPLVCIVDSDDFLIEDAVDIIYKDYQINKNNKSLCEYIYLRMFKNKKIIGDKFKCEGITNPIDLINTPCNGDKCNVLVIEKFKKYRFPEYKCEKFMGELVLWYKVYNDGWNVLVQNKPIYYCEYYEGGLTLSGRSMRIKQPLGGMEHANCFLSIRNIKSTIKIKRTIQFICYGFFSKTKLKTMYELISYKRYFILSILPGWILYKYWMYKYL